MNFSPDHEAEAFRAEVRAFLREHLPPEMAARTLRGYHASKADMIGPLCTVGGDTTRVAVVSRTSTEVLRWAARRSAAGARVRSDSSGCATIPACGIATIRPQVSASV